MKIVAYDESQFVALLHVARPAGSLPAPIMIDAIRKEFEFIESPTDVKESMKFAAGSFDGIGIDSLAIHSDGIVITSRTPTEFLERVFDHLVKVGQTRYGFELIKTHKIDRFFRSVLTVHTDNDVFAGLTSVDPVRARLERALFDDTGIKASYGPTAVTLACDPLQVVVKPTAFRFERKLGVDFSFNLYFTEAPLKTESHLELLQQIEGLC